MSQIPNYPIQPQPSPYHPPAQQNGMAIAGFVLSIVGFFTCWLTSPIGLILSVIGMKKKDQQGLAIAGLILGILGTLLFVGWLIYVVVVMIFLGGAFFWTTTALASAAEQARTNSAINSANHKIQSHTVRFRMLPGDAQGNTLIRSNRDPWGQSLRYERLGNNQFRISSSGPDKRFGSRDDIRRTFTSPHVSQSVLRLPLEAICRGRAYARGVALPWAVLPP